MDPNAALDELRRLVQINEDGSYSEEIRERFEALDEWLSKGGFLPKPWTTLKVGTLSRHRF